MGDNIDSLKFDVILNGEQFKKEAKTIQDLAEKFEKSVKDSLDFSKKLDAVLSKLPDTTAKEVKETTKKAKKQKEVIALTRQELEAKKTAGTATKAELQQLNAILRSDKLLLDEEKKRVQLQKEQVRLQRQQNLLNNGTAKAAQLTTNQLLKQSSVMKGIASMASMYFSVFGAATIVRRLVEITGEFEAQHTALRAILQEVSAADNIFNQLQVLAVKSPFTFKNLVGYAKQLTAFSVPVNEVYETTKKLADVSAGLGVDMGRIILAYGQVRSAEFLRGTEVRQFTEAGIPILKELADQIQEIEGHAISVGEVFERISARQIPFAMVEEAFNRMTSAGGKFYNMQEVLAETVKGKVSNLQDAWEIMLSKIGDEHSGTIKGIVNSLTDLLQHYDRWIGLLGFVIKSIGLYSAGMALWNGIAKATTGIQTLINTLTAVRIKQIGWNNLLLATENSIRAKSIALGKEEAAVLATVNLARKAAVGILSLVAAGIWAVIQHQKRSNEEARKTTDTINAALSKLSATMADFKIGSDRVNDAFVKMKKAEGDATKETKAFNKSVDDLKKQFPKFIDDNAKLAKSVEELGELWGIAKLKMNQYFADEARNTALSDLRQIRDNQAKKITENFTSDFLQFNMSSENWDKSGQYLAPLLSQYIKGGLGREEIAPTVKKIAELIFGEDKVSWGIEHYKYDFYSKQIFNTLDAYARQYEEVLNNFQSGVDAMDTAFEQFDLSTTRSTINKSIAKLTKDTSLLFGADMDISDFAKMLRDKYASGDTSKEIKDIIKKIFEQYSTILGSVSDELAGWQKKVNDVIAKNGGTSGDVVKSTDSLEDLIDKWIKELNDVSASLKRFPASEANMGNNSYKALIGRRKLLEAISESLYGEGIKDFSGNTKESKRGLKSATDALKQQFQDLKELKAAYDKFRELGFSEVRIDELLKNYFGTGIPQGGFNAAFEALAVQTEKFNKNDAKDIRNFISGKDWRQFADDVKNAQTAAEKFREEMEKWLAKDFGLEGTNIGYDISKIITQLNTANNTAKITFDKLRKDIDAGKLAYIEKAMASGANKGQAEVLWEIYKARAFEAIDQIQAKQTAANKKDAQEKINNLSNKAYKDVLRNIGLNDKSLSDWGDKSISQIKDIAEKLKDALKDDNLLSFVSDDVKKAANGAGLTLEKLRELIKSMLNIDLGNTNDEKLKRNLSLAREIASESSKIASAFTEMGDALDNSTLTSLGEIFEMGLDFADVILDSGDAIKEIAENGGNITNSFSVITMIVKGALILVEKIVDFFASSARAEQEAINNAREFQRALRDIRAEGDSIFGENQWQGVLSRLQDYKDKYIKVVRELQRAIAEGNGQAQMASLALFGTTNPSDDNLLAAYNAGLLDEEGKAIVDTLVKFRDTVSNIFNQLSNDIVENMVGAFEETGDSVAHLEDAFASMGQTLVKSIINSYLMKNVFDKYEGMVYDVIDNFAKSDRGQKDIKESLAEIGGVFDLMKTDIEGIAPFVNEVLSYAQEKFGTLDSNTEALTNGIKGITEDTANLLASYLNAIRADVSYGKEQRGRIIAITEGFATQFTTLNDYAAKVEAHTFDIAQNTGTILAELQSMMTSEGGNGPALRTYS